MNSAIYFVKRDVGLFRKGGWTVVVGSTKIGIYPDRETSLSAALSEAERTSGLGRATEVWVNDGEGFLLEKSFQAQKGKGKEGKGEDDLTGDEDIVFTVDDPTTDPTQY
jgi:hypothetical protein